MMFVLFYIQVIIVGQIKYIGHPRHEVLFI